MSKNVLWLLTLTLSTALTGSGVGQEQPVKKVTAAELKKMIEDLEYECKVLKSDDGKIEWCEVTRGPKNFVGRIDVLDDGTTLSMGIQFPALADKVSLATINAWNIDALHTRALLTEVKAEGGAISKVPRLESDLDAGAGLSQRALARYLRRFEDRAKDFVAFLGKVQGKLGPGPEEKKLEIVNLTGTTWKGREDLEGFGDLAFNFQDGQVVFMLDQKQKLKGTWAQTKDKVEIKFGDSIYRGQLAGKIMTGTGAFTKGVNEGMTWKFKLSLQAGNNPNQVPDVKVNPANQNYSVAQVDFPLGAAADQVQVSWRVHYRHERTNGLRIVGAWLKRPGFADWLKVLQDVHVTQFYVPYQDGNPRFFDMDPRFYPRHGPWKLTQLLPGQADLLGPQGRLLDELTVREDRDAGLLWLFTDKDFSMENQDPGDRGGATYAQRRQEMVLWGVYQASNYFYIMQYSFQNDGTVLCRLGSTGKNLPGHAPRETGHMHNGLWRVQFDLGGSAPSGPARPAQQNQVFLVRHEENAQGEGKSVTKQYLIRKEGQLKWVPEEFTSLRVQNPDLKNRGSTIGYDLVPLRYGNARHFAPARKSHNIDVPSDAFTHADFWITSDDGQRGDYRHLPRYTAVGNPLEGPPVIWHISSNLHLPRQEDFIDRKKGRGEGCATVMFSGFEIKPRSVFQETPFLKEGMISPLVRGREND